MFVFAFWDRQSEKERERERGVGGKEYSFLRIKERCPVVHYFSAHA